MTSRLACSLSRLSKQEAPLFRDSAAWLGVSHLSLKSDPDMPLGRLREQNGDDRGAAADHGGTGFPRALQPYAGLFRDQQNDTRYLESRTLCVR